MRNRVAVDPDKIIDRLFGRSRPAAWAAVLLTLYGLIGLFSLMTQHRTAAISADPFSYLQFAQTLSDGSFHMQGPIAEAIRAFRADAEGGDVQPGPIWNTNVLPDGRTVYTVAMGYPLFLSTMFRLGGYWLYTHVNLFLLAFLLFLVFFCVWEGFGCNLYACVTAGIACLMLLRSHPPSFLQFSHPWREPLFYCCILGAIALLQVYQRRDRIWYVGGAGLLLGYACAIKEPNAIYGVVVGLWFLLSPAFRTSNRKVLLITTFGMGGVMGVLPILVQNGLATGNPFRSLQVTRATTGLAESGGTPSISPAHIGETFSRYFTIYRYYIMFWWPCLLAAVVGALAGWRHRFVRLCVGLTVVHLALYLQWGNADFRHMYFVHIPYVVMLAVFVTWLFRKLSSTVGRLQRFERGIVLLPLLALAVWPSPWKAVPDEARNFSFSDAGALMRKLGDELPPEPVLLSNRVLRDVIGIYGRLPVIRLHDLEQIHPENDVEAVLQWFHDQGHALLFLDNADKDPVNVGKVDWALEDEERLYERHDLEQVFVLDRDELRLRGLVDKPQVTAYHVEPWRRTRVERELAVPHDGAAYLYLNPRALRSQLDVSLNGNRLADDPALHYFLPVHDIDLTDGATMVATAGGEPMPALRDVRLWGWTEPIKQDCGDDASPSDGYLFPDGLGEQPKADYRYLNPPARLRVPVRKHAGLFTTVGLGLNVVKGATNLNVFVEVPGEAKHEIKVAGGTAWFPITAQRQASRWAGSWDVRLSTDADALFKLSRVHAMPSRSELAFTFGDGVVGVVLIGKLTPRVFGVGPHSWSLMVNGSEQMSGTCWDDPRRSANALRVPFSRVDTDQLRVAFGGAGLIDAAWVPVKTQVTLQPRTAEAALVGEGIFPPEGVGSDAFWWTQEATDVSVPALQGTSTYRLQLDVGDMKPGGGRSVTVSFAGREQAVDLPEKRGDVDVIWNDVQIEQSGLHSLSFHVETWSPKDHLPNSGDDRELGFQLYQLEWAGAAESYHVSE